MATIIPDVPNVLIVVADRPNVLDVVMGALPGPSGLALPRRESFTTTPILAAGVPNLGAIAMAIGYRVYAITTSAPARVEMYTTYAAQVADNNFNGSGIPRNTSTDPGASSGVVFDVVTGNSSVFTFSPEALGHLGVELEYIPSKNVPITITAMVDGPVTVTVLWVPTE